MDYRTCWEALDFGADFLPPGKIGNFGFQSVVFAAGHFFGVLRILSPILQKIFNLLFVISFTSPFAGVLVNPARQFKVICSIVHQSGDTGHIRLRRIFIVCVTIQLLTKRFKKRIVVFLKNKNRHSSKNDHSSNDSLATSKKSSPDMKSIQFLSVNSPKDKAFLILSVKLLYSK